MKSLISNRKGYLGDIPMIMLMLIVGGITFLIMFYVLFTVNQELKADPNTGADAKKILQWGEDYFPGIGEAIMIVLFLGLPLVSAGLVSVLETNRAFFWLNIFTMFIFVLAGAAFSTVWTGVVNSSTEISNLAPQFPLMNLVFDNYAIYAVYVCFVIGAGMFIKSRRAA